MVLAHLQSTLPANAENQVQSLSARRKISFAECSWLNLFRLRLILPKMKKGLLTIAAVPIKTSIVLIVQSLRLWVETHRPYYGII